MVSAGLTAISGRLFPQLRDVHDPEAPDDDEITITSASPSPIDTSVPINFVMRHANLTSHPRQTLKSRRIYRCKCSSTST